MFATTHICVACAAQALKLLGAWRKIYKAEGKHATACSAFEAMQAHAVPLLLLVFPRSSVGKASGFSLGCISCTCHKHKYLHIRLLST